MSLSLRIEDILSRGASAFGHKTAVRCGDRHLSYSQFYEAALQRSREQAAGGIRRGAVVPLRARPTIDYLTEYFALHMNGAVVVPLASDFPPAEFEALQSRFRQTQVAPDIADILFTTGTTGRSKGVMLTHQAVMADAENLVEGHRYTSELSFLISGPLNHCGCWSKVFPCLLQGATILLQDGMAGLDALFQTLESAPAPVATFLVPSALRILLRFGADRLAALSSRIDFIETGGAPISQADMQQLCHLLPSTRLYNTYASTETGIIATFDFSQGRCLYGCVGRPMKHSAFSLTSEGHVCCSGMTLMAGYLDDPELTQTILRDGIITTTDLGSIDSEGMLHLDGRSDDTINAGAYKVAPAEVENAAMELPALRDCICIAVPHPILGSAPKLLYVADPQQPVSPRDIALHLKNRLEGYKVPQAYEQVDRILTTYNGKKDRKAYKV